MGQGLDVSERLMLNLIDSIHIITLFISITVLCGTSSILRSIPTFMSVPHNIVMDLNNVRMLGHLKFLILCLTAKIEQPLHYELRVSSHGSQVLSPKSL